MQTAPPNCGLLFFEKLHGPIEDKFPCRYFWGQVKKQKLNNMGLQLKICLPDTQFLQNEYLRAGFFPIDPYSSFYALFVAILVSHNSFFLYRPKIQDTHDEHFRIQSSLVIPSGFHILGISSKISFPYPRTFHSVGISNKTSFPCGIDNHLILHNQMSVESFLIFLIAIR